VIAATCVVLAGCRQDMHDAPSYDPLQATDFFANGAASRPLVPNTVARGQLRADEHLYTGKINGQVANEFPMPVTRQVLDRGQERFNVYCSPCHGRTGEGNGMVVQRGFRQPPSYHEERLRNAPVGYFFDVMTNGFGIMPDYASQVSPEDRWKIVAYIRALQLSQSASMKDVPAGQKVPSQPPKFAEPGSGATLPVFIPEEKSEGQEKVEK
jgi:mono/diheme cytochrome c family protein